jgi:initiation factor 1A
MPNVKGGKGYKRGAHETSKQPECNWDDGQMYGRVSKTLGNKRFRVLCNDGKDRVCKLAGSLRKSHWCEEGSFVILSLRGLSSGQGSTEDVGDILEVVEHCWVSKLKKDEKINKALFGTNEKGKQTTEEEDDLFEDEEEEKEEEKEGSDEEVITPNGPKTVEEKEQEKKDRANAREKKNKERDQARNSRRDAKQDSGDIDIDAI